VLTADTERPAVVARLTGVNHVDVIGAEDVPDISDDPATPQTPVWAGRPEQQFAMLAVRLEMTAVYLRLVRGRVECTCYAERYRPMHGVRGPRLPISPDGPVPQRTPEAELWLGTHPGDPTRLVTDEGKQPLLDAPARRPGRTAGRHRPWSLRRHTALLDEGAGGR
jgi:hypothetical protein